MITLINGNIQGANNTPVTSGTVVLQLVSDSQVLASPFGQVMAGVPITFTFSNGNIQSLAKIWSNAELTPSGTAYLVNFYDSDGARINKTPYIWQFNQSNGASVDIGTIQTANNQVSYPSIPKSAADLSNGTTGTGAIVLASSPTLVSPILGAASATSINNVAITAPASSATLTIANGKTVTANNSLTLAGIDGTTLTFQTTGTVVNRDSTDTLTGKTYDTAGTGNVLKINGTQISTVTGTGAVVLGTSPTIGGTALLKRIRANQGTALATSDIGSLSGWGTTASVTSVSGTDQCGSVTIASSGTGQITNPSFVLTFKDGAWPTAPIVLAGRGDLNTAGSAVATTTTTTAVTFFWNATPVAGQSYTFTFITMGK